MSVPRPVSIVVNTYNRAESLARTLRSLEWLDYPWFEVVVVNGPSTDTTDELLATYRGRIKVVACPHRNLSESRNIGIRAAAGEIVAFIDDDAYPDPGWLDDLVGVYDRDEVAAVGGPTFDHTGWLLQALYSRADRFGNAWVDFPPAENPTEYLSFPSSMEFVYTIGTNSTFRREHLVRAGGFDEEFEYYADETDLCCRLVDAGLVVAAADRGFVYHKFLPSDMRRRSDVVNDWYQVLKSRFYFSLKHGVRAASFAAVCAAQADFVDAIRERVEKDRAAGALPDADADRFEEDVKVASNLALERYAAGTSRVRPPEWFDTQRRVFLPFHTRMPARSKLHVVLMSQDYPPGPMNGIARIVRELARELARRGHVVRMLTRGSVQHRVDLEDGLWVHRIVPDEHDRPPAPAVPQHIWNYSASMAEELGRIDARRPVDVVIPPNWDSEGIAAMLDGRYRVLLGLHTPLKTLVRVDLDKRGEAADPIVTELLGAERFTYQHADGFIASGAAVVAEIEEEYRLRLPRDRIGFVPHGLPDMSVCAPQVPPHDGTRFLFVGRLEARKGIDILLPCVPRLAGQGLHTTLVVLGDDSFVLPDGTTARGMFETQWPEHEGRVEFLGRADDQELARQYAACDAVVVPSRYESFGLTILEAMMFAKPVICANVGGMRYLVADGVNGLLTPPEDVDALSVAMARLAGDPELCAEMGRRGRAIYEARFSVGRMATDVERYCHQMMRVDPDGGLRAGGTR